MQRYICELDREIVDQLIASMGRDDFDSDDVRRAVNSRLCDLMHDYPPAALVQVCTAAIDETGVWDFDEWDGTSFIEDITGAEAYCEIVNAIERGEMPLFIDGQIMGHWFTDLAGETVAYILTDCDEFTYWNRDEY